MKFTEQFNKYACVGDYISVDINGVTFTAYLEPDADTRPEDFDCYSEEEIERFYKEDWYYVGLVIEAETDDWKKTLYGSSVWGVDIGLGTDDRPYLMELANECLVDAVASLSERAAA